jgi:hypothetical protein
MIPPRAPSTHPHQFTPLGQLFAVYRSLDGAGGLTRYWPRKSNGAAAAEASVIPAPIDTVLLPMKVMEEFALPDGVDETAAVAGTALVGVLAPADGVGEAALVGVLAPAVVADASLPATPDGAAAAFPACDDAAQPATTASRVADTALANVKRHRRRGCEAGIEELSFDRVSRSDEL